MKVFWFQACKDHADGILFMFAFPDRTSFDDVPQQMSRVLGPHDQNLSKFVIGTKYPFWHHFFHAVRNHNLYLSKFDQVYILFIIPHKI